MQKIIKEENIEKYQNNDSIHLALYSEEIKFHILETALQAMNELENN